MNVAENNTIETGERNFSLQMVLTHLIKRFEECSVYREPFPYFHIENFFPDDFYAELLKRKLQPNQLTPISDTGRAMNVQSRDVMPICEESLASLPDEQHAMWQFVQTIMSSNEFLFSAIKVFGNQLKALGRTQLNVYPEVLIMQDTKGYGITPHTDRPHRLMSIMVYLPQDSSHSHLGTSVYVPKEREFRCTKGLNYSREYFDIVNTVPYVPNSAFGFLRTDNSFHGVDTIEDDVIRDTICYIVKHRLN